MDKGAVAVPVATVMQLRLLNGRAKKSGYERSVEPGDLALHPGDLKCPLVYDRLVGDHVSAKFAIPLLAALARVGDELDRLEPDDLTEIYIDMSVDDRTRLDTMMVE